MTAFEVSGREDSGVALARAAASIIREVRDLSGLRGPGELDPGECAVKVCGDWYGFEDLDSQGRMVLWKYGYRDPFFYGPTLGETFPWRPLIGGEAR